MTWRELLMRLQTEGLLTADAAAQVEVQLGTQGADSPASPPTPWYVRVLVIVSAWIAALLFLVFLFGMAFFDVEETALVLGVGFIAVAVGLRRWAKGLFLQQMAFAVSVTGQACFLFGLVDVLGEVPNADVLIWLAALLLQLAMLVLYPDVAHRFVSVVAAVGAMLGLLYTTKLWDGVHGVTALLVAGTGWLWMQEVRLQTGRFAALQRPVAYGGVFALLLLFGLAVMPAEVLPLVRWWPSTLVLAAGLLALVGWLFHLRQQPVLSRPVLVLAVAVVLVAVLTREAPGVLASLLVLAIGFDRHNRVLMGLALIALALYLGWFYYDLGLSLLYKSFLLMGTGIVLLALRWGIGRFFPLERHASA